MSSFAGDSSLDSELNLSFITPVYLCTDLNPFATRATELTGHANSTPLQPILTNLTSSLLPRLAHQVDVLVFNPPYVETDMDEMEDAQESGVIERAWAGGEAGMVVTNRVLEEVEVRLLSALRSVDLSLTTSYHKTLLAPGGAFYLVTIPQNKPFEIIDQMRVKGLSGEVGRSRFDLALQHELTSLCIIQVTLKRRAGGEHLHILRFRRSQD